jgi:hypothetical protein
MKKFRNEQGKEANKCQEEMEQVLWARDRAEAAWAVP